MFLIGNCVSGSIKTDGLEHERMTDVNKQWATTTGKTFNHRHLQCGIDGSSMAFSYHVSHLCQCGNMTTKSYQRRLPFGKTGRQSKEMTLIVYPNTPRELHLSIHSANKLSAKLSRRKRIARIQVLFCTLSTALHKSASTWRSLKRKGEPLPRIWWGTILWVSMQ